MKVLKNAFLVFRILHASTSSSTKLEVENMKKVKDIKYNMRLMILYTLLYYLLN
jgi:hypothetical protein